MTRKLLKIALVVLLSVVSISIAAQENLYYGMISLPDIGKRHYLWEMDDWEPWYMVIL